MTTLNASASRAMLAAGAHAATDVTGFGLLGHAREMARASNVRLRIRASSVPVFDLVRDMVAVGIAPGGTRANAREHEAFTTFAPGVSAETRLILSDAQTLRRSVDRHRTEKRGSAAGRSPRCRPERREDRGDRGGTRHRGRALVGLAHDSAVASSASAVASSNESRSPSALRRVSSAGASRPSRASRRLTSVRWR